MAKKKYINGSYGVVRYVEKLNRNMEFVSEEEYLEFINDDERIEDTKKLIELAESDGLKNLEVGVF